MVYIRRKLGTNAVKLRKIGVVVNRYNKKVSIYTIPGHKPPAFFYCSIMDIDADGSPHAYNPQNTGLDDLRSAGRPGHWIGIVTHNDKPWGKPVIQKRTDPAPGYFVSQTALSDFNKHFTNPTAYVNAEKIPYIVLPQKRSFGAVLGDMAVVYNMKNGRLAFAVYADRNAGINQSIGEGSIALARALGINSNPRTGGTGNRGNVLYLVFPKSGRGNGHIPSRGEIIIKTQRLFREWGGIRLLKTLKNC
ncbi:MULTISPECIES: glycoside hydrolase family 75 protein [Paenibacillus]|uniref:glycoside hydrolase family 75 protein n=1 Tax=Paenibacillus TaxID=44249 RepID=UPI00248FDBE6|nr:glycoside hydrolase family 75 protein [Paenibacillus tyrfis]